jgi:hypothetical protein
MILREYYTTTESGIKLYRTYSNTNHYIQKIGTTEKYTEAIDVEDSTFEYEELLETFDSELL